MATFSINGNFSQINAAIKTVVGTLGEQKQSLVEGFSAAASMVIVGDNRGKLAELIADVAIRAQENLLSTDQRAKAQIIKEALVAGRDALIDKLNPEGKGFVSTGKGHTFKLLNDADRSIWIDRHARMTTAFETGLQAFGVKVEKTDSEKAEAKAKKAEKAEAKLKADIDRLGLVAPESIRPLDDATMLGIITDNLRAGHYSMAQLEALQTELSAAIDVAKAEHEKVETMKAANVTSKAKAEKKAKADKIKFDAEPAFVQAAILSAV